MTTYLEAYEGDWRAAAKAAQIAHPWPSLAEYTDAQPCPTCKAAPGRPCTRDEPHLTRQHRGAAHQRRDIESAPWPEDREVGRNYATVRYSVAA